VAFEQQRIFALFEPEIDGRFGGWGFFSGSGGMLLGL
jgi:hypothetical protein